MKKLLLSLSLIVSGFSSFAQQTCATATTISTNGTYASGAIDGTYPTGTGLCFTSAATTPRAKWFKFTPTSNGVITVSSDIAANPGGTSGTDSRLSILTGSCAAPWTCIAANDDVDEPAGNYRSKVENVTVLAGTTYYIVWDNRWQATTFQFEFTFTAQSCLKPTNYTITVPATTTSISIGWTAPTGSPIGYEVQYGVQGFTLGTGTTVPVSTNSVALSGLTPSTVYSMYVRTRCTSTDFSVWDGPINFNTVFEAANPPYNTSFENSSFGFIGWTAPTPTSGNPWQVNASGPGDLVQNGNNSVLAISSTTVQSSASMISRGINLTGGQQATLSFWVSNYRATGNTTSTASLEMTYGTSQTVAAQTNVIATETNISSAPFVLRNYTFTPATTGVYYIGIKHTSPTNSGGATHAVIVDNLTVSQGPLSTNEFFSNNFAVYPNPAKNVINISNTINANVNSVEMTDMNGRVVKTLNNMNTSHGTISINDLSAGVYMLKIVSDQGTATKKIIKE